MSTTTVRRPPLFNGPAAAAYLVEQVLDRWRDPRHQRFLAGWSFDYQQRVDQRFGRQPNDIESLKWLKLGDEHIQRAPLYAIEEEVAALIQAGAETMPDQALLASDLPSPSGFALFTQPIDIIDVSREHYGVSALLWTPAQARLIDKTELFAGTMTVHFTTNDDLRVQTELNPEQGIPTWREINQWLPPLTVLHLIFIPHGTPLRPEEDVPAETAMSHLHFIKTLQSFWAFVQQEVVEVEQRELPRAIRKRAQRAQRQTSTLHVVKLRRVASSTVARAEGDHHVNWQSRWIVRGHWRQQWYAKSQTKRAIWIYPFVKGPEDKPLRARRTVFDVRR